MEPELDCRSAAREVDGCANALQCKYHGWTYLLDGTLRGVPAMDRTELFDKRDYGLIPVGHDRCKVVFEWYSAAPPADPAIDAEWTKLLAFSDEIQDEDIEICEVVQRNLRSRVYDRGRYSAARENGVHHFHSLLHEFLT